MGDRCFFVSAFQITVSIVFLNHIDDAGRPAFQFLLMIVEVADDILLMLSQGDMFLPQGNHVLHIQTVPRIRAITHLPPQAGQPSAQLHYCGFRVLLQVLGDLPGQVILPNEAVHPSG